MTGTAHTATSTRKWWVLAGVSIMSFLGCLDLTIVNTAAPTVGRELRASLTAMQICVNAFVVALAMFMVTAGRLSDRYGRRRVLLAGTVLFGLASVGAGAADGVVALTVFRFVQGAAGAVLYTSSSTIVADAFPPSERGRAIGTLFAVNGFGLAAGPLLGGVLVAGPGWRWIFYGNVPLVALALVVCAAAVAATPGDASGARADRPGLALLTVALFGIVTALTGNDAFGWLSPQVLGAAAVGAVALGGFVATELRVTRRGGDPLLPFGLFRNRLFLGAVSAEFALASFYTTALFLMPLQLGAQLGFGPLGIGLMMLPATATVAALSPVTGRLVDRIGPLPVMAAGFVAFAASALLQARLDASSGLGLAAVAFALMGIGWAMTLGPAAVAALSAVPARMSGLAVGASWTFHNVGGAVGLAVGMAVFRGVAGNDADEVFDGSADFTAGHTATMLYLTALAVAAAGWLFVLRRGATAHAAAAV